MAGVNGTRLNDAKIKQSNEIMATATEEVEILRELRRGGYLVAVPPGDDDDAYAIALARGEDDRSRSSYSRDRDDPSTRDDDDDVDARAMSDDVAMEEDGMTTTTLTRSRLPMEGVRRIKRHVPRCHTSGREPAWHERPPACTTAPELQVIVP